MSVKSISVFRIFLGFEKFSIDLYYILYYNLSMNTILKTFRLPIDAVQFLESTAMEKQVSQTEVILESLRKMMAFGQQWEDGLKTMAQDKDYKKEQIALAEENYE